MPTQAEQKTAALATLELYAQKNVPPVLTDPELDDILDAQLRATIWTNNTAYSVGAVVLPTIRNGRRFICIQPGTSEALLADEPEWTTQPHAIYQEGASDPVLTWREDGPDFDNLYNVRAAIHAAWMLKAAKASGLYSVGSTSYQQVYDQCIKQAERFASVGIA